MLFRASETSSGKQSPRLRTPVLLVGSFEVLPTFAATIGIPKLVAFIMDTGIPSDDLALMKRSTVSSNS